MAAGVKVSIAYSEVTEDGFDSCLDSYFSVSKKGEISVVDHASIDKFALISMFFFVEEEAIIISNGNKEPSFI